MDATAVSRMFAAIEDYGRGITIDMSSIEEGMRSIDPSNMEALQEAMTGGLFDLEHSPAQQTALTRLETTLALIEGWVDDVVSQATENAMPHASALREAVRRRRATGGPAEDDLRSTRRTGATTTTTARRRRFVGCSAHSRRCCGPRCGLDTPRCAAHRR